MKLKTWTDAERGRQASLARVVGVSLPTMTRWVNEQDDIPENRARQIERATGGVVTMEEMLPKLAAEFDYMRHRPEVATDGTAAATAQHVVVAGDAIGYNALNDVAADPILKGKVMGCDVTPQGVICSPMPDVVVPQ